jgi:hypothetical protein
VRHGCTPFCLVEDGGAHDTVPIEKTTVKAAYVLFCSPELVVQQGLQLSKAIPLCQGSLPQSALQVQQS